MVDAKHCGLGARLALFICAIAGFCVVMVAYFAYQGSNENLVRQEIGSLMSRADSAVMRLDAFLMTAREDARFLAASVTSEVSRGAVESGGLDLTNSTSAENWIGQLESALLEMARAKPRYIRLRVIDPTNDGREIATAHRLHGPLELVPRSELRKVADRQFLEGAMAAGRDQVHCSNLILLEEHGRVVQPSVPVVRFTVPLTDATGAPFALAMISADLRPYFGSLRQDPTVGERVFLTNEIGDLLLGPVRQDTLGVEVRHPKKIQDEFPESRALFQAGNGRRSFSGVVGTERTDVLGLAKLEIDPSLPDRFVVVGIAAPYEAVLAGSISQQRQILGIALSCLLVTIVLGAFFARRLSRPLVQLTSVVREIAGGSLDVDVNVGGTGEIAALSDGFGHMVNHLRVAEADLRYQNWLKTGLTELSELVREDQDLPTLGSRILSFLVDYVDAEVGAFYVIADESTYDRVATHAFESPAGLPKTFAIGEGVVGQVVSEKKRALLRGIAADHMSIRTGLGESKPGNILVVPLLHHEAVRGVIEIASIAEFTDRSLCFVDQASAGIAVAITTTRARHHARALLEKSRQQSVELVDQREELRRANEELEARARMLEESESRLQAQQGELTRTNTALEERTTALEGQRDDLNRVQRAIQEKARQLDQANRYKTEFLANMSHELRTPLNSLLILSEVLSQNKDGNLSSTQVQSVKTIHNSGRDLLSLIEGVLDLSKVEAGEMTVQFEDIRLDDIAECMERQFRHVAEDRALDFKVELSPGLPETLNTDRQRLEQILKNLLSNAFKFTERGSVELKMAESPCLAPEGVECPRGVRISVRDTGDGIPIDKQQFVFEPFKQVDGTATRRHGGTGLGLSICTSLANLIGGTIGLESEDGEGCSFTLDLPLEPIHRGNADCSRESVSSDQAVVCKVDSAMPATPTTDVVEEPRDDRDSIDAGDKVLLIIEDDPSFASILRERANEAGFKCLVAGSGRLGVELAGKFRPHGVILDIGLPDVHGLNVLSCIKSDLQTRHIPIQVISGNESTWLTRNLGALGFLQKPATEKDLTDVVASLDRFINKSIKELLVVSPDEATVAGIDDIVGGRGIDTTVVQTTMEARELLLSARFDCAVIDYDAGGEDVFDLLRSIACDESGLFTPTILYSQCELSTHDYVRASEIAERTVFKTAESRDRLLDETSMFLHRVDDDLADSQKEILRRMRGEEILRNRRVLVVDDDMRNIFALTAALSEVDMSVVNAGNGREALEILEGEIDIDAILMDMMMPEMDGYEAIQEIRRQHRHRKLPIVALTGRAMKGDRSKCVAAGATEYLTKPIAVDELLALLRVQIYANRQGEQTC